MTFKKVLVSAAIVSALAVRGEAKLPENCPDCGRMKARNADDAIVGACDKWFAVRDKEAHAECESITRKNAGLKP